MTTEVHAAEGASVSATGRGEWLADLKQRVEGNGGNIATVQADA